MGKFFPPRVVYYTDVSVQCSSPLWLRDYEMHVPCGKCRACRISYAREWSVRLLHESDYWEHSSFVTLTYNEETYPADGELSKRDLQLFIKRLRRRLGSCKYYACGEYGDQSGRAHYHAILFGVDSLRDADVVREAWIPARADQARLLSGTLGFVYLGSVSYDSCRYVADYVQKKVREVLPGDSGRRQGPFALMSQGIGKRFAVDNSKQLSNNLYTTIRGVKMGVPKYYAKILGIDGDALKAAGEERRAERAAHYTEKYGDAGDFGVLGHLEGSEASQVAAGTELEGV